MNLIGKMLNNRYEILEKIGIGGMATVYKAKCYVLNRFVAVKILRDEFTTDSEFIKKFNSEAQSAASLTHPNIVSIHDVGNEDNLYYIVMELIQGKTLKEIITEDGILSWKWSVNIAIQIASALETAHKNNIIHRDIKPHNIIITEEGIAKVTDFGIAKAVSNSTITAFGTTIGSVHYFSPEHARGGYTDAKSDLYSLGIVLYEMLTGKVPFDADTPVSVALKQVQEEPVDPMKYNSSIPISVNRIILKAMQKDPNIRYQSATEMLRDLTLALKKPNEDFVVLTQRGADSPTQKIPTIFEIEMEKNNDRNAPKMKDKEKPKGAIGKLKEFYKKHPFLKILSILGICAILFITAMAGTMAALKGSRPNQEVLPNVVGYLLEDAEKELKDAGFKNVKINEEYSDEMEADYVISQLPNFRENFKINTTEEITLVVSKGSKIVTLPKRMVGKKLEEVKDELDKLEIRYEVIEENSEKIEAGIVIAVDPDEGEDMSSATIVKLTVSIGSAIKDVTVPSVLGNPEEVAKQTLSGLELKVSVVYEENPSKSDGLVTEQSVNAGTVVKEGDTITITVNKQPLKSNLTINVNLSAIKGSVATPDPEDENTVTPPIEKATVKIEVGSDTILNESRDITSTVTKTWSSSGVQTVKVTVDGVTQYNQAVDFSKGDTTINIP